MTSFIRQRRQSSEDKGDLLSLLLHARDADDGRRMTDRQVRDEAMTLFLAGHETTVNLIGNGMLALLRNPDQWARLTADPSLAKSGVEEALRYDSPVQLTARWILEDMEFAGYSLKRGEQIATLLGAANRDPAVFVDPNRFDIERDNAGKHLAFSGGRHFCLGAALARAALASDSCRARVASCAWESAARLAWVALLATAR